MSKLSFQRSLAELVLLAILVGLVPELVVGAFRDALGVCGFDSMICQGLYIQGWLQAVGVVVCTITAILVAFMLSDEYSSGGDVCTRIR